MRQTVGIFGIPIDNLDTLATLERLDQFIQERRFHQVATANVDFLINAMHDQELRQILCESDLITPDGMPVVWASRLLGAPLPERVTGADIVPKLAAMAAKKGYRVYMLGARPEVAQRAKERLELANPGLQIVGCVSPALSPLLAMDSDSLLRDIVEAKPDILLVAFGNPKQEKWIRLHRDRLRDVPVCIGVGGTFDFLAGQTRRAPGWVQRLGLEWCYRLAQDPKRLWRRYKNDIVHFSRFLVGQWWATRAQPKAATARLHGERTADCIIVTVEGALGLPQIAEFQALAMDTQNSARHLILDLRADTSIDAATLGTLVNLAKRTNHVGRDMRLSGATPALRNLLRVTRADERFTFFATLEEAMCSKSVGLLRIDMRIAEANAVCSLTGKADFTQVPALQHQLDDLPSSIRQVDIDCRGVSYIDCGMMALLRHFSYTANAADRCVRLIVNTTVRSMLVCEKILNDFVIADAPIDLTTVPSAQSSMDEQRPVS